MSLSEAIERVGAILDCYPNGGQNAARGYIGALAAVLVTYPRCVTHKAADPLTGVPRDVRFLPTPADVIAWCEGEVADLRKIVARDDDHRRAVGEMRSLREASAKLVEDRKARPSYDELKAKYGPSWGLGDSDEEIKAEQERHCGHVREANSRLLAREWADRGELPMTAGRGIPISVELASMFMPEREAAE
jgi:hypothetical protein